MYYLKMYYFTEKVESPCPVIKGGIKIIEKSGNSKSGEQNPEGGGNPVETVVS